MEKFIAFVRRVGVRGISVSVASALFVMSMPFAASALAGVASGVQEIFNTTSTKHPVTDTLSDIPAKERGSHKGREVAALGAVDKVQRGEYAFAIDHMRAIDGGVELFVRAWDKNGAPIGFGADGSVEIERFRVFNPPILVDDPKGAIIRTWTDEETGETMTRRLREDVREALVQTITHAISVKKEKFDGTSIEKGKIGNTTDIFYPDAGEGATSVDGWMETLYEIGTGPTWSTHTARTAADHTNDTGTLLSLQIVSDATGGDHWRQLSRGFLGFNTAPLGTDVVTSATMSVFGTTKQNGVGISPEPTFDVYTASPASNNVLVAEDFDQVGSVSQTTGNISLASWNTSGYNTWTLSSVGVGNINKTGVTNFSLRNNYDVANAAPNDSAWASTEVEGYAADQTGTANDPQLVVEHAAVTIPLAPTGLQASPVFSAIFNDPTLSDTAVAYQLQVHTYAANDGFGNLYWDSGKQTLGAPVANGQRTSNLLSTTTFAVGKTYSWRIRFWDETDSRGKWSTTTPLFMTAN